MVTNTKKAFTIIEVTLSMAFVSVLLITISLITLNIISLYQKGLAMRSVNSVGTQVIDEITRTISGAPSMLPTNLCSDTNIIKATSKDSCVNDEGFYFVYQQNYIDTSFNSKSYSAVPSNGAYCTGSYSYIWNTGYAINSGSNSNLATVKYYKSAAAGSAEISKNDFHLLKIQDPHRDICTGHVANTYTLSMTNTYSIPQDHFLTEDPEELLSSEEDNLIFYDADMYRPVTHKYTNHTFYSGTFTLGTLRGDIDINSTGNYCSAPPGSGLGTDYAYCAVNKFNFAIRATGENKG